MTINMIFINPVSGDDSTGAREGSSFKTIAAGLQAAIYGDTVVILPGTHTVMDTLILPSGVSLIGEDIGTCILESVARDGPQTWVIMGEYSTFGHCTFNIKNHAAADIYGIRLPGTTSLTAKLRNLRLNIDNSAAGSANTNVIALYDDGVGSYPLPMLTCRGVQVVVTSSGSGMKRGLYMKGPSSFTLVDCAVVVADKVYVSPGSFIAIETDHDNAVCYMTADYAYGKTAELSQKRGKIIFEMSVAHNQGFNSYSFNTFTAPKTWLFSGEGSLPTGSQRYLRVGSGNLSATEYPLPIESTMVVNKMFSGVGTAPGDGNTCTVTLLKNSASTGLSFTLSGAEVKKATVNQSVKYVPGDTMSIICETSSSNNAADIVVGINFV